MAPSVQEIWFWSHPMTRLLQGWNLWSLYRWSSGRRRRRERGENRRGHGSKVQPLMYSRDFILVGDVYLFGNIFFLLLSLRTKSSGFCSSKITPWAAKCSEEGERGGRKMPPWLSFKIPLEQQQQQQGGWMKVSQLGGVSSFFKSYIQKQSAVLAVWHIYHKLPYSPTKGPKETKHKDQIHTHILSRRCEKPAESGRSSQTFDSGDAAAVLQCTVLCSLYLFFILGDFWCCCWKF